MPESSADRPLLLPEEIKSFTEEDVVLVAGAIGAEFWVWDERLEAARDVLAALATAGRLLPASAEHREEEFTVEYVHPMDREYRRQRMEPPMRTLAEVTEYAAGLRAAGYVDVKIFRRSRAVAAGPWTEGRRER